VTWKPGKRLVHGPAGASALEAHRNERSRYARSGTGTVDSYVMAQSVHRGIDEVGRSVEQIVAPFTDATNGHDVRFTILRLDGPLGPWIHGTWKPGHLPHRPLTGPAAMT
jgi:hypothetical protein